MALGPGSIAFTGFNADGADNLAFVALEEIPAGTVIFFQDNEWTGSGFNTGESSFSFTATGAIAAGTVVRIDAINSDGPTSNLGAVTYIDGANKGLSNDNEIVYAFIGSSATQPTAFLSAVTNSSFTNGATLTGTGLAAGSNALELGGGIDIGAYTGSTSSQTSFAGYRALLNNPANWTTQNGSGDQSADGVFPDAPFATTAFTLSSVPTQTVRFAANSLQLSRAEGNSGTTNFTFTIERVGGTDGAVTVSGSFAAGTTDAADFGGVAPAGFSATIPAGRSSATVTIQASGDTLVEATESFSLTITDAVNGGGINTTIAQPTATGTIQNDDAGPTVGGIRIFNAAPSLAGNAAPPAASDEIVLVRLGEFTGSGSTAAGRAESVAFDADRIFVTNLAQNRVDIARLGADGSTAPAGSIDLAALQAYGGVNSVAVKNGVVAVAYQNVAADQPGFVALFDLSGNLQKLVQVGILPDQLTFTPDGLRILVANEGEAVSASNNPAGSISIISLAGGPANAAVSNTIGFSSLNGNELVLAQRGLALFSGQSAAGDVEPEYISVSPDGTRAYVTLQEVNGIAVIDLTDPTADRPLSIQPLGAVDRTLAGNAFDPSDQNGISLVNANVQSLLQPDAIAAFTIGGLTYFVTANEGDARVGGLSDEVRLSNANYRLDPTAYPNAAELKANAALGRLNVLTTVGDTDGDGDFDQIFTFGGRSISIFRQEADGSLTKVRETGGEFEAIIARDFPSLFNVENGANPDNRSDNKGPEPEGVSVGQVGDRIYAFVTLERVGGVMVYDVTDPANARFVSYKPATAQDFAPETVQFVAGAANATGQPLLLSANEGSGTTTLYRVVQQNDAANLIQGAGAADTFNARGGDDTIQGAGGNDRIDGGAGTDTAVFGGARADYLIDRGEGGTITVRDMREGAGDGIDTLSAVELFQFADGTRSLSQLLVDETVPVSDDKQGYRAGRAGNDELFAIGADAEGTQLRGNRGDDLLVGGAYDDVLVGNFGDDVLVGGAGADQFRFFGNEIDGALDVDRIFDLNFAEGDRLVFGEFASGTFARSRDVTAFAGGSAAIVDSFSDLRKLDAASDRIIVTRLNPSSDTLVVEVANGQGQVQRILISDAWQNYQTETGAPLL